MKTSIIIPTFNRKETLGRCLQSITEQSCLPDEVLVIDDGSIDGTEDCLKVKNFPFPLHYHFQANAGPSKARNKGISESRGDLLIFIGDDILLSKDFIASHLANHSEKTSSRVVIGKTVWAGHLEISSFMKILEKGIQFDFDSLTSGVTSYKHCYTSNLSVQKNFLIRNNLNFNESFPYAAHEDIEWGYRMSLKNAQFIYVPAALGYHDHWVDMESYKKRMYLSGKAYAYFCSLHPEILSFKKKKQNLFLRKIKAKIREWLLNHPALHALLQKLHLCPSEEKCIKSVLSYYEEKGFQEENAKIKN